MPSSLSADQRKALVRHYLETVWNTQKEERSDASPQAATQQETHPDIKETSLPASPAFVYAGDTCISEALELIQKMMCTAFPDLHLTIVDMIAEGEKVVARWTMQGTDLGGLYGHLPTGRQMRLTGMTMVRFENDTMVEEWNEADIVGMLHQLGFVHVPQPPRITMRRS